MHFLDYVRMGKSTQIYIYIFLVLLIANYILTYIVMRAIFKSS